MWGARNPRLTLAVKLSASVARTIAPARNERSETSRSSSGQSVRPLTIGLSDARDS